jgi:hypothetical protein
MSTIRLTRPGRALMTTTRSDSRIASGIEWVMNMTVVPGVLLQILSSSVAIRSRVIMSSAPNGSSISRNGGPNDSARAIATRCCIPPDSSYGWWLTKSVSPTSSASSATRASISRRGRRRTWSGRAMFAATVRQSNRTGDWNTIPNWRRRRASRGSSPLAWIRPPVGVDSPATSRRSVDLPQPDGPMSDTNVPIGTSKLTSSSALTGRLPLKTLSTPWTEIAVGRSTRSDSGT